MPGHSRPSFSVVSGLVLFLALFGFALKLLKPSIPPVGENALADERSMFLRQAGNQRINWLPLGDEVVAEARSKGLPIMLVVGSPWSKLGRDMDRKAFSDNSVADFLRRHFVSTRVDLDERPDWRNAFLPLSRAQIGLLPDLQIAFLEPDGYVLQVYARRAGEQALDAEAFLNVLIEARDRHRRTVAGDPAGNHERLQIVDLGRLGAAETRQLPNLRAYAAYLRSITGRHGGFAPIRPVPGAQRLYPLAWQFLAMSGQRSTLEKSLLPALQSGIVDWLDGGFFHLAADEQWERIDFDKLAIEQAAMGLTVAQAANNGDPFQRAIAKMAFDSIVEEFMDGGLLRSSRRGDEAPNDRSLRSSFSPRKLWDLSWSGELSSGDLEIGRTVFGLNLRDNRPMVLRASQQDRILSPSSNAALEKFRKIAARQPRQFSDGTYLDVNGYAAARMIEGARLWSDKGLLREALALLDGLEDFHSADDVSHSQTGTDYAYLGDYLAYADARLQDYLATGRVPSFDAGVAVLRRALVVFRDPRTGTYNLRGSSPLGRSAPELIDNIVESTIAQLIRLLDAYGRLTQQEETGLKLRKEAFALASRYQGLANEAGLAAAGYFAAMLRMANEPHAVAVGLDAIVQANRLHRLRPFQLVAPAFGPVRADLQRRAPGIYVVDAAGAAGPMTVAQAAARLGRFLKL
ncbi:MAG: DUF255 domain-containing protein [Fimbriimonadaceae bacterium]